jgi:hypothetical protein
LVPLVRRSSPCRTSRPPDRRVRPHPTNRNHVRERTGPRSAHHRGRRRSWCSGRWTDKHLRRRAPLAHWGCGIAWMRRHPGSSFRHCRIDQSQWWPASRFVSNRQLPTSMSAWAVGAKVSAAMVSARLAAKVFTDASPIPAHTHGWPENRARPRCTGLVGKSRQSTARFQVRGVTLGGEAAQSITAASLRSVIGLASSCWSQTRCSLSSVSSRPAPTLRPGVKVAGSFRMPWMTPMVS